VSGELDGVIVAVLGSGDLPRARAHFQVAGPARTPLTAGVSYTPPQAQHHRLLDDLIRRESA